MGEGHDRWSLASARAAAATGRTAEWVGEFLATAGGNEILAAALAQDPHWWVGPVRVPLVALERLAGPEHEDDVLCPIEPEEWEGDVAEMESSLDDGWEPPPLLAEHQGGRLLLQDGNHRFEALVRQGAEDAWVLVYFDDEAEASSFEDRLRTMSEVIERYQGLAEQFGARVEATPDDRWDAAAPCEGWTARDVVAHIVSTTRGIAAGVNGGEATPMGADEDPKEAWRSAFADVKAAIASPGALEKQVPSPMGPMALETLVGRILSMDILVHTWDLARATGGDEQLDQDAVAHAYEGLKPADAMLRRPGLFGDKVEPPEGADLQTEFLCFLGRRP